MYIKTNKANLTTRMEDLVHQRFYLNELEKLLGVKIELSHQDIGSINLSDHDLITEINGYEVDIYFIYDRHGKMYITEVEVR